MSSLAPLRDRAPSNAGKGWKPQSTTPLRIAKRDSPQPEAQERIIPALTPSRRRSVRNLADGARVSNSPFVLSQLSAKPGAIHGSPMRRVSGEKRPRSHSMSDQAENENPAVRKRRQSQVSELLVQKKPVTNSSFKSSKPAAEKPRRVSQEPVAAQQQTREPSPQTDHTESDSELAPPPPPKEWFGRSSPHRSQSPSRPSLVSRRLHGPRMTRRHSRRKTVTFDEKCDVLEFDVEEDSSNPFDWVTDDDENYNHNEPMNVNDQPYEGNEDDHERPGHRGPLRLHNPDVDESFDGFQVGEDSITGLVDSMLQDALPNTPPHDEGAPDDLGNEDGVSYGRPQHAERITTAHQHQKEELQRELTDTPLPNHSSASTPSQSREGTPATLVSSGPYIPLDRSSNSERPKEQERFNLDDDLRQMPPSPSPAKLHSPPSHGRSNTESFIPRFALDVSKETSNTSKYNNTPLASLLLTGLQLRLWVMWIPFRILILRTLHVLSI